MEKLTVAALTVVTLLSGSASAHETGEFFMHTGSAAVCPTEGAGSVLESLGGFSVTNNTQLGLTFTHMATDNIGMESLVASPLRHKVDAATTGNIVTVHHLPSALMVRWYFGNSGSEFRPYISAGINYTTFFNSNFNDTGEGLGLSNSSLKDSWSVAEQVGLDYLINRDWLLNMSVWYMDIDTEVKYKSNGTVLPTGRYSGNVRLNPWVSMFSAGYCL